MKTTKQDYALKRLTELLDGGSYPPGSRLPTILELAESLGLKERPVREALKQLSGEGKIHAAGGKGLFVGMAHREKMRVLLLVGKNYQTQLTAPARDFFLQMEICDGILKEIKKSGGTGNFHFLENSEVDDIPAKYREEHCTGIINLFSLNNAVLVRLAAAIGFSRIVDARYDLPNTGFNEVRVDFRPGITAMLEEAYRLGHRRMAILHGRTKIASHLLRLESFLSFCRNRHLPTGPAQIMECGGNSLDGYRRTLELLRQNSGTTLIFAATDRRAEGALQAIRDMKMTVGRDISVIGFDNMPEAAALELATVAVPRAAIGAEAVKLLRQSSDPAANSVSCAWLDSTPLVRGSLGIAPGINI